MIRSSLGKPRRLSLPFLREERQKLENNRKDVRTAYQRMAPGAGASQAPHTNFAVQHPTYPLPLHVGQRVTARHPRTRNIHDGQVLTVDVDKARIQFYAMELGSELLKDTEVMPVNRPAALSTAT
jgi:hypothetical protein